MKTPISLLALSLLSTLLVAGCGDGSGTSPGAAADTNAAASGGNPLTAPVDYLGAVGQAQRTADKTADVASINRAIQLFEVEHGRYPNDLNELVQKKFLPATPQPPYGMKFVYDAGKGTIQVVPQ